MSFSERTGDELTTTSTEQSQDSACVGTDESQPELKVSDSQPLQESSQNSLAGSELSFFGINLNFACAELA